MSNSNMWIICFNECGSDSITYVDGRKSIDAVHDAAMKHYNKMKKFKGCFSHQYGIGMKSSKASLSKVNTKQFTIAEYN